MPHFYLVFSNRILNVVMPYVYKLPAFGPVAGVHHMNCRLVIAPHRQVAPVSIRLSCTSF